MKVIKLVQLLRNIFYISSLRLYTKATPEPTMNPNPFSYVKKSKITSNKTMRSTGASWYELMQTVSIIGMVFSFFVIGIMLAYSKSGEKRNEVKKQAMIKIGIFLTICAFAWLFGQAVKIAASFIG